MTKLMSYIVIFVVCIMSTGCSGCGGGNTEQPTQAVPAPVVQPTPVAPSGGSAKVPVVEFSSYTDDSIKTVICISVEGQVICPQGAGGTGPWCKAPGGATVPCPRLPRAGVPCTSTNPCDIPGSAVDLAEARERGRLEGELAMYRKMAEAPPSTAPAIDKCAGLGGEMYKACKEGPAPPSR